ncbi:alpha-tocopherol transfer protein-like [Rhynchophorus ferrugineus]|uniref:CRAL-TRIO domain-containing protein n=1 Tax=Rhynchophorus ferrugineus TaxID=354439 RepID=A0A834IV33_RHYFE|nr:hypothetical protein GWI33_004674 [Rhynchophorus ferrugineus]
MDKCMDVAIFYEYDKNIKKIDVELLIKWCQQQRHFPNVTELQVILVLRSCYYRIESAKNCIENYFTIRTLCPDFFSSYDISNNSLLKQQMDVNFLSFLPGESKDGDDIVLTKLVDTNPEVYNPQVGAKLFDMAMMLHTYTKPPSNGTVLIIDMKGSVFMHITKINLSEFKKFLIYLQTAMPIRLKQIHFINVVPFMDKLLSILKPFINKEMFEKIIIHSNNDNLYKYISKDSMPAEYGGKAESIQILADRTKKTFVDNLDFYEYLENQLVDENKRIGSRKNVDNLFGSEGTFKKLEVD